jgi:hypothetical protein
LHFKQLPPYIPDQISHFCLGPFLSVSNHLKNTIIHWFCAYNFEQGRILAIMPMFKFRVHVPLAQYWFDNNLLHQNENMS